MVRGEGWEREGKVGWAVRMKGRGWMDYVYTSEWETETHRQIQRFPSYLNKESKFIDRRAFFNHSSIHHQFYLIVQIRSQIN